ncbi:hypothetical protein L6164_033958 [Bauhinia variegata]|uniref:Uncharacterized protein n=1 Tax=Bauhinia variegata TaxID=167791 RepID=A0ACB9KU38_BAUVA|nr:hypothetical protein L6164_033958 [Bauhinia variegata]
MSKKKLCTPLSTFMRTSLTSPSDRFTKISSSQIKFSTFASPSPPPLALYNPTFHKLGQYFLGDLGFCGKSICSKAAEKLELRCWNCHSVPESLPFLFCESCRSIQPVDKSVNYFDIFGSEKKYDIEDKNLEGKYKEWQKKLHPDLVHSKSKMERDFAAEQSSRVIDAYRTLKKPLLRAIYLLKLEGVEVDEEQTVSDPELLAEIMEIREAVEEADGSEALKRILSQMQDKLKHLSDSFDNAFQSRSFEEAKTTIQRMTYYERVIEEVVKKL